VWTIQTAFFVLFRAAFLGVFVFQAVFVFTIQSAFFVHFRAAFGGDFWLSMKIFVCYHVYYVRNDFPDKASTKKTTQASCILVSSETGCVKVIHSNANWFLFTQ